MLVEDIGPGATRDSHVTLMACVSGLAKEGRGGDALGLRIGPHRERQVDQLAAHPRAEGVLRQDVADR